MEVDEGELQDLYSWVDDIPLSRPKRNIARDFSDGVLVAEVVHHFFPRDVQLHNYSAANSFTQKMYNWNTLNAKVFHKLGFAVPKGLCEAAARAQPMSIEKILKLLRFRFAELMQYSQPVEEATGSMRSKLYLLLSGTAFGVLPSAHGKLCEAVREWQTVQTADTHLASYAQKLPSHMRIAPRSALPDAGQLRGSDVRSHPQESMMNQTHGQMDTINELREMNEILETKTRKLEQLVRLKDAKIHALRSQLQGMGHTQ